MPQAIEPHLLTRLLVKVSPVIASSVQPRQDPPGHGPPWRGEQLLQPTQLLSATLSQFQPAVFRTRPIPRQAESAPLPFPLSGSRRTLAQGLSAALPL